MDGRIDMEEQLNRITDAEKNSWIEKQIDRIVQYMYRTMEKKIDFKTIKPKFFQFV